LSGSVSSLDAFYSESVITLQWISNVCERLNIG